MSHYKGGIALLKVYYFARAEIKIPINYYYIWGGFCFGYRNS
jgi:hypothetical protein